MGLFRTDNMKSSDGAPQIAWIRSNYATLLRGGAAALLAVAVLLVIAAVSPSLFGYRPLVVTSGSMEPALKTGDAIVLKKTDPADMKVDDIVTYKPPGTEGTLITHRVVSVSEQGGQYLFETKGDANPKVDAWTVNSDGVVGTMVYRVPFAGYILEFGDSAFGRIVTIGIPLLLLVFQEVRRILLQRRRQATPAA